MQHLSGVDEQRLLVGERVEHEPGGAAGPFGDRAQGEPG
ncbi:hypothetical protein F4560_001474 [Saccharothrix ecbatanensis]|uniref:Uncharacterized protein n=1 Tax=Saccharothrix ecbatanensis TaxID=1105145 RepID=A0A7W9HGS7_9PSEU|nr:hypothetical protein [Saccharothrix ecbatanensis]